MQRLDIPNLDRVLEDRRVAVAQAEARYCSKPPFDPSDHFPEYYGPLGEEDNPAYRGVREAFCALGYDDEHFGTSLWNPLCHLINPGETVVLKPNWVNHKNLGQRAYGLTDTDCLITHGSILRAVLDYVCLALKGSGRVIIGDAPIQNADWKELMRITGAHEITNSLQQRFPKIKFEVRDFRLEHAIVRGNRIVGKTRRKIYASYIEIDLKEESLLFPLISDGEYSFGVANYPSHRMVYAHSISRNAYLFPRDVLDADVFINLPKIKTHLKGGITCSLKNLVGLIGMKDYLPHFRYGSPKQGGDEYPDSNWLWYLRWWLAHKEWERDSGAIKLFLWDLGRVVGLGLWKLYGYPRDYYSKAGGGWFGNDTIWRTILDINRAFFYYDRSSGTIQPKPLRSPRYLAIVDGLTAGHRESPLCPTPKKSGLILMGTNPVAIDSVMAALIGFDISKIPQISRGFSIDKFPLALFNPDDIDIVGLDEVIKIKDIYKKKIFIQCEPSHGWTGHIEYESGR